jgi:hypothetical protein
MPAPSLYTFSADAKIAAHQSFVDLIDAGSSHGNLLIRDSADVLLASVPMNDPCGSVNGTTGQVTFSFSGPDTSADHDGNAAYAEFVDSNGVVHLSVPVQQGTSAVSGKVVMNTVAVVAGYPVTVVAATLG